MKTSVLSVSVFLCLLFFPMFLPRLHAEDTFGAKCPAVYNESADGAQQVADAMVTARKEGKHILLQFGANWCPWCLKLHTLFESDKEISDLLKDNYVVVLVDVNNGHNKELFEKYNHSYYGIPFLVVLDENGKLLVAQKTSVLEEGDHHSPQKVLAFLKTWVPKVRGIF